ncbi:MAG: hypothetical protein JKY23_00335 [Nitrospinaceae bacterium]|nr:hypothetical protein [Nitrospinaceae bacterium]
MGWLGGFQSVGSDRLVAMLVCHNDVCTGGFLVHWLERTPSWVLREASSTHQVNHCMSSQPHTETLRSAALPNTMNRKRVLVVIHLTSARTGKARMCDRQSIWDVSYTMTEVTSARAG